MHFGIPELFPPQSKLRLSQYFDDFEESEIVDGLFVLGDFVDVWLHPLTVCPPTISSVLHRELVDGVSLLQAVRRLSKPVVVLPGNHDHGIQTSDFFGEKEECNSQSNLNGVPNVRVVDRIQGDNFLFSHGHEFDVLNRELIEGMRPIGYYSARFAASKGVFYEPEGFIRELMGQLPMGELLLDFLHESLEDLQFFTDVLLDSSRTLHSDELVVCGGWYSKHESNIDVPLRSAVEKMLPLLRRTEPEDLHRAFFGPLWKGNDQSDGSLVVLGHTHTPELKSVSGHQTVANTGTWTVSPNGTLRSTFARVTVTVAENYEYTLDASFRGMRASHIELCEYDPEWRDDDSLKDYCRPLQLPEGMSASADVVVDFDDAVSSPDDVIDGAADDDHSVHPHATKVNCSCPTEFWATGDGCDCDCGCGNGIYDRDCIVGLDIVDGICFPNSRITKPFSSSVPASPLWIIFCLLFVFGVVVPACCSRFCLLVLSKAVLRIGSFVAAAMGIWVCAVLGFLVLVLIFQIAYLPEALRETAPSRYLVISIVAFGVFLLQRSHCVRVVCGRRQISVILALTLCLGLADLIMLVLTGLAVWKQSKKIILSFFACFALGVGSVAWTIFEMKQIGVFHNWVARNGHAAFGVPVVAALFSGLLMLSRMRKLEIVICIGVYVTVMFLDMLRLPPVPRLSLSRTSSMKSGSIPIRQRARSSRVRLVRNKPASLRLRN